LTLSLCRSPLVREKGEAMYKTTIDCIINGLEGKIEIEYDEYDIIISFCNPENNSDNKLIITKDDISYLAK